MWLATYHDMRALKSYGGRYGYSMARTVGNQSVMRNECCKEVVVYSKNESRMLAQKLVGEMRRTWSEQWGERAMM